MKSEMKTRERFHAIMNFKSFDRLPVIEWATWWDKTIERWRAEGLPANLDRYEIYKYFGMDVYYQEWVGTMASDCPKPAFHGAGLVKNEKAYEDIRKHLFPENCINIDSLRKHSFKQKRDDVVIWMTLEGFFWFPRKLFGIEEHLYAFYDQPELMHRMNNDLVQHHLKVIDKFCEITVPDFMTFAEDMSYNNGPMISKELFDQFIKPYYQIVVPALKGRGIRVFIDSDGDISIPAKWFTEAGIEGILPLERQAGVDISLLRKENPEQLYIGAYDKMVMNKGEEAMRKEFERLLPTAKKGGFLISCDHQTPPGVSLEEYKTYLKVFKEYARKAAE